jgi:hypothetical protein
MRDCADVAVRACAMGTYGTQHAHAASSPSRRSGPDRDADAARVARLLARAGTTRAGARDAVKSDIALVMECVARRTRAVCDMLLVAARAREASRGLTSRIG